MEKQEPRKPCQRFETEGLASLEAGQPLAPHFAICDDCLRARATYEALAQQIADVGASLAPPPHWQEKVWARIEPRRGARRSLRPWGWAGAAALAATLALFFVVPRQAPDSPALGPGLEVSISGADGPTLRGLEAQPGDRLELAATLGDATYGELRLYRQDRELILRCGEESPCQRWGDRLRATATLPSIGSYQPLLVYSDQPIPTATDGLDADVATLRASSARVELGKEIEVR